MDFNGKKILLLGFGGEARAALRYIKKLYSGATVNLADQSSALALSSQESELIDRQFLGEVWLDSLTEHDVIIRSPGVPLAVTAQLNGNREIIVTSGTNIFLEKHRHKTWAVTGTKGKSTTSSLLYQALRDADVDVRFGGNIGIPALSLIDENPRLFVLELSSYQLEDCCFSPHGAVLLNLFDEHLDHHGSKLAYAAAKANIAREQTIDDILLLPAGNQELTEHCAASKSRRIYFGAPDARSWIEENTYYMRRPNGEVEKLFPTSAPKLKGPGNRQNILAVIAAASEFDLSASSLTHTICSFTPLPHRLEEVATVSGVGFINDSISTVPEATINALETFGDQVRTLILGGFDRGLSFEKLANYLMNSTVDTILLLPPSGARIQSAIAEVSRRFGKKMQFFDIKSMEQAVTLAKELTPEGHICLLSPASPSFPLFKNFEERGALFKKAVLNS